MGYLPTPTFLYRHQLYLKLIGKTQSKLFLDVGTGNGYLISQLDKLGFKGLAIDNSPLAIKLARPQLSPNSQIKLTQMDFLKLPQANKFDQVFCFEVLEYINNPASFIRKIAGHLKPGGRLILSAPAHKSLWSKLDQKRGHRQRFDKQELIRLLEKTGFKVTKFYSYGFPVLTLIRLLNSQGLFVKPPQTKSLSQASSLIPEYPSFLKWLFLPRLWQPIFWLQNIFLNTNWGVGWLVEAKKA